MKMMIEGYVLIIGIMILCLLSTGYISVSMQISNARNFHSMTVDRLETSHFASSVKEDCLYEAQKNGYQLNIEDLSLYEDQSFLLVELNYTVKMPFLNIVSVGNIQGYAR